MPFILSKLYEEAEEKDDVKVTPIKLLLQHTKLQQLEKKLFLGTPKYTVTPSAQDARSPFRRLRGKVRQIRFLCLPFPPSIPATPD